MKIRLSLLFLLAGSTLFAQADRWQQRISYLMNIDMDVSKHQYQGAQKVVYSNNSPDTLYQVFWHLYFNAFKPGSMMDVRSRNIADPDRRVGSRIAALKPEEQGFIKVKTLKMNGKDQVFETNETILEVNLSQPILPYSTATFEMNWDAQVPKQIRRSGRDNAEGISYSMAQWYPKMCEYDYQGWHSNPYVGREFYGVWGDFDVRISIDEKFVVAAGGYLQNPLEVGSGYENPGDKVEKKVRDGKMQWHFIAPNVHDFVWAADPDYLHDKIKADDGTIMHFFYQKRDEKDKERGLVYEKAWKKLPSVMNRARTFMNTNFGKYPYQEYYFIQGGDGGMEYPMATLITGKSDLDDLIGVSVHEQLHTWYQMLLGSNESLYAWMDEGFTSWAETLTLEQLAKEGLMEEREVSKNPFKDDYRGYRKLHLSGKAEPMSTHADHYQTNRAYSTNAYVKGAVMANQLGYIVGNEVLMRGMRRYFETWKFKHPNPNDFIRILEKESGLELDWYKEEWVNTLNIIDYGIVGVNENASDTCTVVIQKSGLMAMPVEVMLTLKDGSQHLYYAPLESMRGLKPAETSVPRTVLPDHRWVDNLIFFDAPFPKAQIRKIEIDPTQRLADMDMADNVWEQE